MGIGVATSGGITSSNIATGGIATANLANGAVTPIKMSAPNIVVSSSCGNFSTTSGSNTLITNFSSSITTSGKPVTISFQPDGTTSVASFATTSNNSGTSRIIIERGGTGIAYFQLYGTSVGNPQAFGPGSFTFIDQPSAGTYTYAAYAGTDGVQTFSAANMTMVLREL